MTTWSKYIKVRDHFLRSVRIDSNRSATDELSDFLLHKTGEHIVVRFLDQVSQGQQRAFTWTGPYGTGKSSLAQFLAEFLSRNPSSRKKLNIPGRKVAYRHITDSLGAKTGQWLVVRIAGTRRHAASLIGANLLSAINSYPQKKRPDLSRFESIEGEWRNEDVFELVDLAKRLAHKKSAGLLIVVDEMGKLLEHAVETDGDLHLFQEIAERFGESKEVAVFLGVLHQAFQEYAGRIERRKRTEWSKVQGRFEDVPFSLSIDESVSLIGEAIVQKKGVAFSTNSIQKTIEGLSSDRFQNGKKVSVYLNRCLPLHPLTALVLAFSSRQKFGQNERSVFSFLASKELYGFKDFISSTDSESQNLYTLDILYDYLKTNLEQSILASPSGQQWAEANEALERVGQGSELHVKIVKAISLLDQFGRQFGVRAHKDLIVAAFPDTGLEQIEKAIQELSDWSIILFRRHLDAFVITEGSDLDVDREVRVARSRLSSDTNAILEHIPEPEPVIAKRHYHFKGTLRWFNVKLMPISELRSGSVKFNAGRADGLFVLAVVDEEVIQKDEIVKVAANPMEASNKPVIIGLSEHTRKLVDIATEVAALERVISHLPELQTDKVARREVNARLSVARDEIAKLIRTALLEVTWYFDGAPISEGSTLFLSEIASLVADKAYNLSPVIRNELINRHRPSSAANKACRSLVRAITLHGNRDRFGFEKYPAEVGIYMSVLRASGIHFGDRSTGTFRFTAPTRSKDPNNYLPFWKEAEKFVKNSIKEQSPKVLAELYEIWARPPFGMRVGVMPILAMAFIMSRSDELAVYVDGQFEPNIDDFIADRIFKTPRDVALRLVPNKGLRKEVIARLAQFAETQMGADSVKSALGAAREFAQFAHRLEPYVKQTKQLSSKTREIRDILLNANDPHALLFEDLPKACGIGKGIKSDAELKTYVSTLELAHSELRDSYGLLVDSFRASTLEAFNLEPDSNKSLTKLREMATRIAGHSTDANFSAASLRLESIGKDGSAFESLASLLTLKPMRNWVDEDILRAKIEVKDFAQKFVQILDFLQTQEGKGESALSLQSSGPILGHVSQTVSLRLTKADEKIVRRQAESLKTQCQALGLSQDQQLATLGMVLKEMLGEKESAEVLRESKEVA